MYFVELRAKCCPSSEKRWGGDYKGKQFAKILGKHFTRVYNGMRPVE